MAGAAPEELAEIEACRLAGHSGLVYGGNGS